MHLCSTLDLNDNAYSTFGMHDDQLYFPHRYPTGLCRNHRVPVVVSLLFLIMFLCFDIFVQGLGIPAAGLGCSCYNGIYKLQNIKVDELVTLYSFISYISLVYILILPPPPLLGKQVQVVSKLCHHCPFTSCFCSLRFLTWLSQTYSFPLQIRVRLYLYFYFIFCDPQLFPSIIPVFRRLKIFIFI